MDPDIADRIRDWPSRSIEEAHQGLRTLADADFSGALSVEGTWVFLLNGQIVGLSGGTLDDIAETAGTAYQAPGDALPLLFAMQSGDDAEPRAQYYTEETPLSDVDETLSTGGFTGYLELSENVLSGDYYVGYHGGQSRAVAIVGTREEVILGEEAYELAADEVGIYEVIEAPISLTDIPRAPDPSGPVAGASGGTADDQDDQSMSSERDTAETPGAGGAESASGDSSGVDEATPQPSSEEHDSVDTVGPDEGADESSSDPDTSRADSSRVDSSTASTPGTKTTSSDTEQTDSTAESHADGDAALDTSATTDPDRSGDNETSDRAERLRQLETEVDERTAERDRLRERVGELESALDSPADETETVERRNRSWTEVIGETSLFVRYESRSDPTLDDLRDGVERDALASNLVLDYHTSFDDATVTIDGVPFDEALQASAEWSFLTWLVRDLPFEIRDTGRASELTTLYDALPQIDRVELEGSVATGGDGERPTGAAEYDLICRDKTGNPLIVADFHDGRDPVSGSAIETLVDRTSALVTEHGSLAAAYAVSPSFFRPDALEAAKSATSSSFLSRDARLSYVKVDRKIGYHLWLVEARHDDYHVTVPEL